MSQLPSSAKHLHKTNKFFTASFCSKFQSWEQRFFLALLAVAAFVFEVEFLI